MTEHALVTSILLAAGRGRRIGEPKVHLQPLGRSLLAQQVAVAQSAGVDRVVVVLGAESERAKVLCERLGAHPVENPAWESGQTSSVQAGLRAIQGTHSAFMIHPIDHAFVRCRDLQRLLAAARSEGPSFSSIFRPFCAPEAYGHPVLFPAADCDRFLALPPEAAANQVYRASRQRVQLVPVDNPQIGMDVDTPQDLECLRDWLRAIGDRPERVRDA